MSPRLTDRERMLREITEKDWQNQVLKLAATCGWSWYHTHRSERSPAGFPDLTLWGRGRIIFAELKRETGELSPKQVEVITGLRANGAEVYVWRPRDLDEVALTLNSRST